MKVLFVQLSDIHFKQDNNSILLKQEKLYHALQNKVLSLDKVFLLITGDSAFSGKEEEFDVAYKFIIELKKNLITYGHVSIDIIVIPGNHDCNFKNNDKLREAAISSIERFGDEAIDYSIINALTSTQVSYFKYANSVNPVNELIETSQLLDVYKYEINDKVILINCLNTAYISQLHEKAGTMHFPISIFDVTNINERSDLTIFCFHHPLHWLMPENRRELKNVLEKLSDVCLTGHEHEFTKSNVSDFDNNITYYIEGDVLQDSENVHNSGFNTILFDLTENKFLIENYKWNKELYDLKSTTPWKPFERSIAKLKNPNALNKEFEVSINDVGFNITHPNISHVSLKDLYTYPRIDLIDYAENSKQESVNISEDSEAVINALNKNIRVFFFGSENIGKTSLLRVAFIKLHAKGFIPILVEGIKIKTTSSEDFIVTLYSNYLTQYNFIAKEEFLQISKEKIVVLIDDFNRVPISKKYRNRLLSNLSSRFDNIIITNNETSLIEDLISEVSLAENLNFKFYQVKEFGHQLKSKLINKWVTLGVEETISEEERIDKLNRAETIIRIVTGKNLVPNYPIFILTLLQAIEVGNPTDLTASTFGHYYQYLIQRSFNSILKNQDEITSYNNYLSEFAFYLFIAKIRDIDYNEFDKFDKLYRKKYTISHKLDNILKNLLSAKIFEETANIYEFKYLYIYYFFISKYLADNINDSKVKEIISAICKRIYKTEFANIVLFLTHHTKHDFLLDEVIENSKKIFSDLKPCELESGNKIISSLAVKVPKLVYQHKNVDEHRNELNEQRDKIDEQESSVLQEELSQVADINEDISKIDLVTQLNLAFKTIEVLGQILKNNYGKIPNPIIYNLVEETYLLGLRTLNLYFEAIEEHTEVFIAFIEDALEEKNISDVEKIKKLSRRILFNMCNQISYSFIKKISDSLGTENLETSYELVLKNNNYNSIKLVNFAIKLDYFKAFPNSEMRAFKADFSKAPLALTLMQRMVINYLYLFPTTTEQRQKILSFLNIPISLQREIDFRSKPDRR